MSHKKGSPLISICIPTFGREEILEKTLESIYTQDIDASLFEVCVSDNSPTDETEVLIKNKFGRRENLVYRKSTCEGYLNSIEALKMGKGNYLKLHNNYSRFRNGSLIRMLHLVDETPADNALFFTLGIQEIPPAVSAYDNFDSFLNTLNYFSTWSSAFGIWKTDFEHVMGKQIHINSEFPHTCLLFELHDKNSYIIDNNDYVDNIPLKSKGGYNLVQYFGVVYMNMVADLLQKSIIHEKTLKRIKGDILRFISQWYTNVLLQKKYTFSFENKHALLCKVYGFSGVVLFWMYTTAYLVFDTLKLIKKYIIKICKKLKKVFAESAGRKSC